MITVFDYQNCPAVVLVKILGATLPTLVCQAHARDLPKIVRNWEQGVAVDHVLRDAPVQLAPTLMVKNVSIKQKSVKGLAYLPPRLSRPRRLCLAQVASGRSTGDCYVTTSFTFNF